MKRLATFFINFGSTIFVLTACCALDVSPACAQTERLLTPECKECHERKAKLCASECTLVPPKDNIACQRNCVEDYCQHKCGEQAQPTAEMPASSPLPSPADDDGFVELPEDRSTPTPAPTKAPCDSCLDQQFNLCESVCAVGTDRVVAICKLECSTARCENKCGAAKN